MKLWSVHERIYVRGHTRHLRTERVVGELLRLRIGCVVNVALIEDVALREAARLVGIAVWHRPLSDSRLVDAERVESIVALAAEQAQRHAIVVHCDSGRNRSFLIAVRVLVSAYGWSPEQAVQHVRALRADALANRAFEHYVLHGPAPSGPRIVWA